MNNASASSKMQQVQRNAAKAEALLKQLANAKRLMVLCHLATGEKTAGDLVIISELSQSALSQHLAKLREAGLVESEKRGLQVYYRLCSMEAQALLSILHLIYCK